MNNQKLQNFIDLVTFDQNLIKLESLIATVQDKINILRSQLEASQEVYEQKLTEQKDIKKKLDLQELDVKSSQEKEQHQAGVLQKATNPREQDAAQRELDAIQVKRNAQEQKLMQLWNVHDQLEKEVEQHRLKNEQKQQEIQEIIAQQNDDLRKLQQDLQSQNQQRATKLTTIPEDWVNLYDNMRGRVSDPVVPVTQDSCSACYYIISSKDLQTLKLGELVQCKDCYRFLYAVQDSTDE